MNPSLAHSPVQTPRGRKSKPCTSLRANPKAVRPASTEDFLTESFQRVAQKSKGNPSERHSKIYPCKFLMREWESIANMNAFAKAVFRMRFQLISKKFSFKIKDLRRSADQAAKQQDLTIAARIFKKAMKKSACFHIYI